MQHKNKIFLWILLFFLPCSLFAQNQILAKIQVETQNNLCSKDAVAKLLEKESNRTYEKLYAFKSIANVFWKQNCPK